MQWRRIANYSKAATVAVLLCIVSACGKHEINYKTFEKNISLQDLQKQIGCNADQQENENGTDKVSYECCEYGDYQGTMCYYFSGDKYMMSRWLIEEDDLATMRKAYDIVCSQMTNELGKGNADEEKLTTAWTNESKSVTVGCNIKKTEDVFEVYIMEIPM